MYAAIRGRAPRVLEFLLAVPVAVVPEDVCNEVQKAPEHIWAVVASAFPSVWYPKRCEWLAAERAEILLENSEFRAQNRVLLKKISEQEKAFQELIDAVRGLRPRWPGEPDAPDAPYGPYGPYGPGMPGMPRMPGMPGMPRMPRMPGMPRMPRMPGMPDDPYMPGILEAAISSLQGNTAASAVARALLQSPPLAHPIDYSEAGAFDADSAYEHDFGS